MHNQPDPTSQEVDQRPWTVIVRDGRVLNRYRAEETHAQVPASMPASLCGDAVEVWEVDVRMPEPPAEGQPVDPVALGWTSVSNRACTGERPPGRTG